MPPVLARGVPAQLRCTRGQVDRTAQLVRGDRSALSRVIQNLSATGLWIGGKELMGTNPASSGDPGSGIYIAQYAYSPIFDGGAELVVISDSSSAAVSFAIIDEIPA